MRRAFFRMITAGALWASAALLALQGGASHAQSVGASAKRKPAASAPERTEPILSSSSDGITLRGEKGRSRIAGLRWDKLELDYAASAEGPVATLYGFYAGGKGTPVTTGGTIERGKGGAFTVQLPLRGPQTSLELIVVEGSGRLQKEPLEVHWPGFAQFNRGLRGGLQFSLGLAGSLLRYSQSNRGELAETGLTVKANLSHPLPWANWDIGGNVFVTALALPSGSSAQSLRFLGANLRLGYAIPFGSSGWRVLLAGGMYYSTTLGGSGSMGYRSIFGPQLFPVIARSLPRGAALSAYFKYSPISAGGFDMLNVANNREIAAGAAYSFRPSFLRGRRLWLNLDYATLRVQVGSVTAASRSLSFGPSFEF